MIFNATSGANPLNFNVVGQAETPESTSRNLIVYPFYQTTLTNNGITFTDNGDGTVTANGTATALARFRPAHTKAPGLLWLEPGTYTASGCPSGGDDDGYRFEVWDNDANARLVNDTGNGAVFTLTAGTHVRFSLLVASGLTVSKLTFKPQLEKGSVGTAFVKYAQKENLIWVKSGTALLEWYMRGSSDVPTWADEVGSVVFGYEASGSAQITGTSTVLNLVRPSSKRRIAAKLTDCFQNLDGTKTGWTRLPAYIYKSGGWIQFSDSFSATIKVTYPSGSTLTCTDGTTTLKATTTTGSYTFTVPNTGTWTVTSTKGSQTKSTTVSITADGQSASVTLSYTTYYYNKGDQCTSVTGGWTAGTTSDNYVAGTPSFADNKILCNSYGATEVTTAVTNNKVDLTNVSTLHITSPSGSTCWYGYYGYFCVRNSRNGVGTSVAQVKIPDGGGSTVTLDVSSLTGSYYLMLRMQAGANGADQVDMSVCYGT